MERKKVIEEKKHLVFEGCNIIEIKAVNGDGTIVCNLIQEDENGTEIKREGDFIYQFNDTPYEVYIDPNTIRSIQDEEYNEPYIHFNEFYGIDGIIDESTENGITDGQINSETNNI